MIKVEIAVCGAGLAGLLTTLRLAQSGLSVALIEKLRVTCDKKPENNGRTSALMTESLSYLEDIGIWNDIKEQCAPLENMRIIDGDTSTTFELSDINLPYFGQNVPNNILRAALINKIKTFKNVTILDDKGLWDFEEKNDHMVLRLNDDSEVQAKLLIGADGKNSLVRSIAGIKAIKTGYNQTAMTCLINHSRAHDNTSIEFHKHGGPFTLVPCPGNQSAVVWCEKHTGAEELLKLKKTDFEQALQDMSQNVLGEITLEHGPESWPLKGVLARKLVAHRLVLIAEAAHALHPIGAQGLNLSLRDIRTLTDLIIKQKELGLDVGDLEMLKTYKALRRNETYARFAGVTGLCKLTSKKSKRVRRLRQAGLGLLNRSSFLKRQAMKIGLGAKAA